MRDEREKRDGRDGGVFEVSGTSFRAFPASLARLA